MRFPQLVNTASRRIYKDFQIIRPLTLNMGSRDWQCSLFCGFHCNGTKIQQTDGFDSVLRFAFISSLIANCGASESFCFFCGLTNFFFVSFCDIAIYFCSLAFFLFFCFFLRFYAVHKIVQCTEKLQKFTNQTANSVCDSQTEIAKPHRPSFIFSSVSLSQYLPYFETLTLLIISKLVCCWLPVGIEDNMQIQYMYNYLQIMCYITKQVIQNVRNCSSIHVTFSTHRSSQTYTSYPKQFIQMTILATMSLLKCAQ